MTDDEIVSILNSTECPVHVTSATITLENKVCLTYQDVCCPDFEDKIDEEFIRLVNQVN